MVQQNFSLVFSTDNGISKYVCFLKTTCIIQICLGIMLIICGGLTVAYTQGQTVDKRPFCYAAMFVCGAMVRNDTNIVCSESL